MTVIRKTDPCAKTASAWTASAIVTTATEAATAKYQVRQVVPSLSHFLAKKVTMRNANLAARDHFFPSHD